MAGAVAETAAELGVERGDAGVDAGVSGGGVRGDMVVGDLPLLVQRCGAVGLRVTDVPCGEGDCLFGAVGAGMGVEAAATREAAVMGLQEHVFGPMDYEQWEDWVVRWCPRNMPPPAARPTRVAEKNALRERVTAEVVAAWGEGGRRVEAGRQCLDALGRKLGVCVEVYKLKGSGVPAVEERFAVRGRTAVKVLLHNEHYYALSDVGER